MRKPDFFIVGGPKCGTTALYTYLREHPAVFMPSFKEPLFFCRELPPRFGAVTDIRAYLALFECAGPEHRVLGEASSLYLSSHTAISNIRDFNPSARIVVMVRNPIEVAHAFHAQLLRTNDEDVQDFEKAWNLQQDRRAGRCIPPTCRAESMLQYLEIASLGSQLARVLEIFPAKQVHTVVFDDFVRNTRRCYIDLLHFLGVNDDGRTRFHPVNENAIYRIRWINRLLRRPPGSLHRVWRALKKRMGIKGTGLGSLAIKMNTKKEKRGSLPSAVRHILEDAFEDEIKQLEMLLKREFTHWRSLSNQAGE